uniref:Magnesium transporter n=1 Tax=Globisporangium ultimum (strain ATCC 200006 / CBS 805.95 / DAOM BR144) TaxID=431595 RepID=K3WKP9_GLOUD
MDLLSKWKHHSPLQMEVDLEMLAPDLVPVPEPSRKRTKTLAIRHVCNAQVLLIDVKGNVSMQEMRRSEILKMTQEAAKSPVKSSADEDSDEGDKQTSYRPPEIASPRASRRSFSGAHMSGGHVSIGAQAVHMRDLRKLDANFSETNEPCIVARKQAILINADPLRTIIMRNVCIVFIPDGADSLISILKDKFRELVAEKETEATPFEFSTFPMIMKALERLATTQITSADLDTLRTMKNTINDFASQVEGIRRALLSILDNEEDLRLLYLTPLHANPESFYCTAAFDPEVAEVILESYLQEVQTIRTKVKLLEHRIQNTESLVMLKLDATRNHLLAVDVVFGLVTVSLTLGMYITAGFGMNLRSGVEETPDVFASVFVGSFVLCAAIVCVGTLYFRRHGVLSL